jgi:acyl-CoA thioester hydrolase
MWAGFAAAHALQMVTTHDEIPMSEVQQHWPDLAGRLVTRAGVQSHILPIRVYFEDTDFSGLDYLKPARIDERLEVTTKVKSTGAATLTLTQRINRDGAVLCDAEVMVVLVAQSGRVLRLSKALRDVLA